MTATIHTLGIVPRRTATVSALVSGATLDEARGRLTHLDCDRTVKFGRAADEMTALNTGDLSASDIVLPLYMARKRFPVVAANGAARQKSDVRLHACGGLLPQQVVGARQVGQRDVVDRRHRRQVRAEALHDGRQQQKQQPPADNFAGEREHLVERDGV